jgi:hypothetical protein
VIFLMLLYDVTLYFSSYHGLRPRWKDVCNVVEKKRGTNDIFLAHEGDVAQYYLGLRNADWYGKFSNVIGTPAFPPSGVTGVWYGIYLTDSPILKPREKTIEYILRNSRLIGLFPVNYGPKDRTIALFYEEVTK